MVTNQQNSGIEKKLAEYSKITNDEILNKFNVKLEDGLKKEVAEEKLDEFGRNKIESKKERSLLSKIRGAVINPFNVILIIVAIVTFFTDVVLSDSPSYATFILILAVVAVSSVISFNQEEKSSKAVKNLQSMISNKIDVIRDGKQIEIDITEAVPGDIVKLSSGDMIPGDVRFLITKDLFIDQASLTGESNPVEKFSDSNGKTDINSLNNIGFMGSNIVSGSAKAIILETGNRTYFGSMAKSISTTRGKTSFEKGIDTVSSLLIKFMIIMVSIISVVNFFTKDSLLESIIFAITIGIGLMPEMLPVVMTSTLAKGAVQMSKKKTIIKRLGAIQTFGEMDILCTDKTGTLTEDRIILEKYMNAIGNEDLRILKHAFLNSYFQTGLKNSIDVAIIKRTEKEGLEELKSKYVREDEIPFDFSRRRMSVVLKDESGKRQLITKGAVEEIVSICNFIERDGQVLQLTEELKEQVKEIYEKNNKDGLRVLAIAQKNNINGIETFGVNDEKEMVLIGFVGFLDPPKVSAKPALNALNKHGVEVKVLTGDTKEVAITVCEKLGIDVSKALTGIEIEGLTDDELKERIKDCHLLAKLSPFQKKRIIRCLQENGHTVGYMGDGINDAPSLHQADVGISVDSAVDIAKETADIVLLEKNLKVLDEGVMEGRRTFANISKYLKMATSGNFGNMISIVIASMFLPFLPLLPVHILVQNLLNDFAQLGMPFDKVEEEYINKPKKWETKGITRFMVSFGFLSTILDVMCFIVLWYILKFNTLEQATYFQCGWFMFGIISQSLVIHIIRTHKIPFIQSVSSKQLAFSTLSIVIIALTIGFTSVSKYFNLVTMPREFFGWLVILMFTYLIAAQINKKIYIKKNHEWI